MTTDRLPDIRRRIAGDGLADREDRSMRWLERGLALTAIAVVVLLALARAA